LITVLLSLVATAARILLVLAFLTIFCFVLVGVVKVGVVAIAASEDIEQCIQQPTTHIKIIGDTAIAEDVVKCIQNFIILVGITIRIFGV